MPYSLSLQLTPCAIVSNSLPDGGLPRWSTEEDVGVDYSLDKPKANVSLAFFYPHRIRS